MTNLYTPTEQAILCDYFNEARPQKIRDLDLYAECAGVYVHRARYSDEFELSNAVARIALKRIQNKLPVWACIDKDGEFVVARVYEEHEPQGAELLPLYLFMINWADSGPGFSWPESYHLVWLPGFDRYVVTASQDSPDCYGFEDIAIGHAPFAVDRKQLAKEIIRDWWDSQYQNNDQAEWECLFGTGFITSHEAYAWRDEVWNPIELEDEDG